MSPINTTLKTGITSELETQTFTFTLVSFRITDTRSRHEDTDYVSFTLLNAPATGTGTPQTLKKSMGNLNNGNFKVNLSFPNVVVANKVVFNYLIVNSGHSSESEIYSIMENAGGALATKGLTAAGAALGSLIPIPLLGTLLGAGAGWLVGELKGLLSANCDGAVAAEQDTFTYADLVSRTANGPFTHETKHPGTNSPDGCGGNSMYYVTFEISRGTPVVLKTMAAKA